MKTIFEFKTGRSGSSVSLVDMGKYFAVLKTNVKNIDLYLELQDSLPFNKPKIYDVINDHTILMEYIPGITITDFLKTADNTNIDNFVTFISHYIDYTLNDSVIKDYTDLIIEKKAHLDLYVDIDLTTMPTVMPSSKIHGDLTFDNMIYYKNCFYMIDFNPTPFDSIYFDINKLRQDLSGYWFLRNDSNTESLKIKTNAVYNRLTERYNFLFNDDIYKFMLARVMPYLTLDNEKKFILNEINNLSKRTHHD